MTTLQIGIIVYLIGGFFFACLAYIALLETEKELTYPPEAYVIVAWALWWIVLGFMLARLFSRKEKVHARDNSGESKEDR